MNGPGKNESRERTSDNKVEREAVTTADVGRRIGSADDVEKIKPLIALRERLLGLTPRDIAVEFDWSEAQVKRWLERFGNLDSGLTITEDDRSPRSRVSDKSTHESTIVRRLAIVGLVFFILLVFVEPGILLGVREGALSQYGELRTGSSPPTANESLFISDEDVAYLNRIFREQDTEVGYCGLIDDRGVLTPWLAEIGEATHASVSVSARNCPTGRYNRIALMHTHPNGDARLSDEDRSSLGVDGISFVCIQHGRITATDGDTTNRLRCYADGGNDTTSVPVRRVPVQVVDNPT